MLKLTFQTEQDYIDFVQTACIFTHLRAYNAGAYLWKEADLPYVQKVRDDEFRNNNFEEWKKCIEVWTKAEEDYGEELTHWRDIFCIYSDYILLRVFGFEYPQDEDDEISIEEEIDLNITTLERNSLFPKSFPCVVCLENGNEYDGPNIDIVYLDDFKKESPKLDFGWLKENVRQFWMEGKGSGPY